MASSDFEVPPNIMIAGGIAFMFLVAIITIVVVCQRKNNGEDEGNFIVSQIIVLISYFHLQMIQ